MFTVITAAIGLTFLTLTESRADEALRVISGRDASPDEYPYVLNILKRFTVKYIDMGQIQTGNVYIRHCTGSLITSTWVLTAAHCLKDEEASTLFVRYGDMTIPLVKAIQFYIQALKLVVHPYYKKIGFEDIPLPNDIGLMQTEAAVPVEVGRLSAVDYSTLIGAPVTFAGFGRTKYDLKTIPYIQDVINSEDEMRPLQVGDGGIIPCPEDRINRGFCVAAKCNNRDQMIFKGDSGGPLFYKNKIVGVNAYGSIDHTNKRSFMTFHTPVSYYLEWINNVIR